MALTIITQPRLWESAQLPVLFDFNYEIVLPTPDPMSPDYIGSYLQYNDSGKLTLVTDIDDDTLIAGDSFYIGSGTSLKFDSPVTILSTGTVVFGGGDLYKTLLTDKDYPGGDYVDLYTLEFVEAYNPSFNLYVEDLFVSAIRYDQMFDGSYRVNLLPYLRKLFRDIGFPGMLTGVETSLFYRYRLDYIINGEVTTGTDKYVINSMVAPTNPSCSDNLPNWQPDLSTLRCQYDPPRLNANRVTKLKDVNISSPTYNTYKDSGAYFFYDSNSVSCPVTYSNVEKSQVFTRDNCTAGYVGSLVVYTVPAGTYTSTISQGDADSQALQDIADNGQAYANSHGTCDLLDAVFEFRDISNIYAGSDVQSFADVYIVYDAGGPITLYYDIRTTNSIDSSESILGPYSILVSGTEVLVESSSLFYEYVENYAGSGNPNTYQKFYENLRTTP